ncbi:GNAT family N-acetyltransferase [Planctomycetota bacterium]
MIRRYQAGDEQYIAKIYHDAIIQLAAGDYTPDQLHAWANPPVNVKHWKQRCATKQPFVKEQEGRVVGFIELDPDGHIDCTYVDPVFARTGIVSEIMHEVKRAARASGIRTLFAEVSKTARPFFVRHNFTWIRDNQTHVRGVLLENYIMECDLAAELRD